jgi:aldehyde dehydrogenase (NAD+)
LQTITKHYINGTFVESHGSEVMDIIKPTNRQVIARVTMADEQDTKRAIAAAVFVNVKNDMTIAKEEIFGPVLSVIAYASEDEAVKIANDSEYGLHAAVLGTDLQRARRVASQIRSGRVVINNMTDDPQAPWGGFKYSGVGREYGRYGIEAFLEPRAILE